MKTLSIKYDGLKGLLNSLDTISSQPGDVWLDTWEIKIEDCTTCANVIKHERFNQGAKEVITDGCKVPNQFIIKPDTPIKCEHYNA